MSILERNARKVVEYKTGEGVAQHEMLKKLLDESGLGRNEWHKRAQGIVGIVGITRSLGSVNKLSDIFKGEGRSLPMRDIVPYIQALELNKKEEGHYIAEFLKAHCDENLHQYIRSSSNTRDVGVNIRVEVLLEEISGLRNELAQMRFVQMPMHQNTQFKALEREVKAYKSAYKHSQGLLMELSSSVFQNETLRDDFGEDIHGFLFEDGPPLELELLWERTGSDQEAEEEYWKYEDSYIEKSIIYELANWLLVFQLILQRNSNHEFLTYIALFIPKDAISSIHDYIEKGLNYGKDVSLSKLRSNREVVMQLFSDFMSEHPEEFEKELLHYVEHKDYDNRRLAESMIVPNFELEVLSDGSFRNSASAEHQTLEPIRFERYVSKRVGVLRNWPLDLNFLKPRARPFMPEEYGHYLKLKSLGVLERNTIAELYQLSSASIAAKELQETKVISSLVNKIAATIDDLSRHCDISNPIQKHLDHENYPLNLKEYYCYGNIDDLSPFDQFLI